MQLVIGDKNLSSWSLRAWLVAKQSGLDIKDVLVLLDRKATAAALKTHSPSQKVPCLVQGDLKIWDSLAIAEYLAELAPNQKLWPADPSVRAMARSYCAEMHSGFPSLRNQCPMDIRLRIEIRHLLLQTISEIGRIRDLWEAALKNSDGPFLFGEFGIADAFYTPVIFRFQSYGIKIESPVVQKYMQGVLSYPFVKEWSDAAMLEKPVEFRF